MEGNAERARKVWLCLEAHALPIMESASALTSAKIDLLPHQVVLTHRIATASPRRFLVADEVGLGKTIETALILRELASRGELARALMVVPAGLVNNWHREWLGSSVASEPLVQEELGCWRTLAPEELGIAVEGDVEGVVLLSF